VSRPDKLPDRHGRSRSSTVGVAFSLLTVGALLLVSGCSIRADSDPRALPISTTTTSTPTVTPTVGGSEAAVFYVLDGQLIPVSVSMPDHRVSSALTALFDKPDESIEQAKLTTSIPVGTTITDSRITDGTLTLDLSREFENVVGPARQQAIGQIVLTASDFPAVERVRFEIDGDPLQVATPSRGDVSSVTDCDYRTLLPTADDIRTANLSPQTIEQLETTIDDLDQRCPTKP